MKLFKRTVSRNKDSINLNENIKIDANKLESEVFSMQDVLPRLFTDYSHSIYTNDSGAYIPANKIEVPYEQQTMLIPLFDDILLGFGIDIGDAFKMLQNKVKTNPAVLKEHAIKNLEDLISKKIEAIGDPNDIFGIKVDGDFEATVILLSKYWDIMEDYLKSPALVAIPTKNSLYFSAKHNLSSIDRLKGVINHYFKNADNAHLLSKGIYERVNKTWKLIDTA